MAINDAVKYGSKVINLSLGATYASPALSNGQIFVRTGKAVYCIGQKGHASR